MSTQTEIKQNLQSAIQAFQSGDLFDNGLNFFGKTGLGYSTVRQNRLEDNSYIGFKEYYIEEEDRFDEEKALVSDWNGIEILFQLTEDEMYEQIDMFSNQKMDNTIMESYLFVAIELSKRSYSRTKLSNITREINRLFQQPVMVLFQYQGFLTLSIINRRIHKRDESKDVLDKITFIKDIRISHPNRAHIEILFDLSFRELTRRFEVKNFVQLHQAWQKTLSVAELNKRFYSELSNWYFWALQEVEFPEGAGDDETVRNATGTIRLITRLIFLWFLKEKNLIPENLFSKKELEGLLKFGQDFNDSTYYKAILQNLFFATLNSEMDEKRKFRIKNSNGRDGNYLAHNRYRYEAYFTNSDSALKLFRNIPFLNGGLFECLDKKIDGAVVRIDGFSDHPKNALKVPDFLFFSEEKEVDLNESYGTKNKRYKVWGILNILDRYKFTIAENTPLEEEVALDPELLGRVFENLLASYVPETETTARKQTGSFYTPREIVNYMVDETLITHLITYVDKNQLSQSRKDLFGLSQSQQLPEKKSSNLSNQEKEDLEKKLRLILNYEINENPFDPQKTTYLIKALDNCKILDPACGSGAFPMGALLRMVHLLHVIDPKNEEWEERQISRVRGLIEEAENISDSKIRIRIVQDLENQIKDIEEAFQNNELDYGRKLFLIQNCIYGVDIQPIAVQIAKLRFFISLIVDQKVDPEKPNLGIRPLPNLETNFVAADTLIAIEKSELQLFQNSEIEILKKELQKIRNRYFTALTIRTKDKCRSEDKEVREQIKKIINLEIETHSKFLHKQIQELNENLLLSEGEMEKIEQKLNNHSGALGKGILEKKRKQLIKVSNDIKRQVNKLKTELTKREGIEKAAQQLAYWDPYDQNTTSSFFDREWMFGLQKGFDIVIGNPPYRSIQKYNNEQKDKWSKQSFEVYANSGNIYFLFFERGINLLKSKGVLSFITSNQWMRNKTGQPLREFFLKHVNPKTLIDFKGTKVFSSVAVLSNILILTKEENKNSLLTCDFKYYSDKELQLEEFIKDNAVILKDLTEDAWLIFDKKKYNLRELVIAQGERVGNWKIKIYRGILTGFNKAFYIKEKEREKLLTIDPKNEQIIVPFLRGKDLRKYVPNFENNWLIFTRRGINIEEYPAIKNYLRNFYEDLKPKSSSREKKGRKPGRYEWYEIQDSINYYKQFKKPKMIFMNMTKNVIFSFDPEGKYYANQKCYIVTGENIKYLTAFFNSKIFTYCFKDNFPELLGDVRELSKVYFVEIPVLKISGKDYEEKQKPIETLVDYIICSKNYLSKTTRGKIIPTFFDQIIDGIFYELYFEKKLKEQNKDILKYLQDLPPLDSGKSDTEKIHICQEVFDKHYHPDSEVRNRLFYMDSIEEIRLIEGKDK